MAKPGMDYRKMLLASLLTIGVGVVLVILSFIISLLSIIITDDYGPIVDTINTSFLVLLFPAFLILYFWTGVRAVKNYGFDAVGAGAVTALSYAVTAVVQLILEIILAAVIVSRPFGSGGFGSTELALASSLFSDMVGLKGVALSAICGIGIIILGMMINFAIGGFGGLFALRKSG